MGRGRVELKRIENKINRQVTFSKRRTGLLKKAREISVLCDAHIALIVFSTRGKLSEYSSQSSTMEKILERYEHYSSAEAEKKLIVPDSNSRESLISEHAKLKGRVDVLEKNHKNYMGEELDSLCSKELHSLEHQLDTSLKNVRTKKNQLLYQSVSDLRKKDKALTEHNHDLSKKVKQQETEKAITLQAQWDDQQVMASTLDLSSLLRL